MHIRNWKVILKARKCSNFIVFIDNLKRYYDEPIDAIYAFEDPTTMKQCWKSGNIDVGQFSLSWDNALISLMSVYSDYPLLFFVDPYRTGGNPQKGIVSPIIDAESSRGDFRRFYIEKIEEDIKSIGKDVLTASSCREAALKVYNIIRDKSCYDHSKGEGTRIFYPDIPSHSVLNYVRNRSAVCEGFARVYQAIMNYISIPAVYVNVNTNQGPHACNIIYLTDEKQWLFVDVTVEMSKKSSKGFAMPAGIYRRMHRYEVKGEYYAHMPEHNYAWSKFLGR